MEHIHALPPGTRLEEYRLDTVLGAGGFGITYQAWDANLDKLVAVKEYLPGEFAARTEHSTVVPHSSTDAQDYRWGLERFLDEARTLARFDHPNLNKVYRFFEANGTAYMVLEYIRGETLGERLARVPTMPEAELLRLLDEVLSGLAVVHEAGYVHRDIKPGNLMLREEDGSAVVLDFGAARQAVGQRSKRLTTILTPGYAPIEQYDSKADDVGPWSDIYSLGMVAYRCISGLGDGELPDAVTRAREQRKGEEELAPAPEAGRGSYGKRLLEAIDWALRVDEEARPQGIEEWRAALSARARKDKPGKPAAAASEKTGLSWTGAALTLVIAALLGATAWQGWQLYRGMPEEDAREAVAAAGAPAGGRPGPQASGEPGEQTEETPTGTGPGSAPDAALADGAGAATAPAAAQPDESPPAEQDEVSRLLAAAEADLEARRLTSPAGNNAWEKYQQVLGLSPANPAAMAGMERVIGSYLELFGAALEQEDIEQAESYLSRIRDLHPDSPALAEARQRLQAAQQAQAAREAAEAARLAEQERQRQAEEAARLAELERQRIAEAVAAQWGAFEEALEEEDFDAAANAVEQVGDLDSEEPGLAEGERRLAAARQEAEEEARALVVDMASIPGGRFRMGDMNDAGLDWEKPVHSVTVPSFRLGRHEVTFDQWDACVADGGCKHRPGDGGWGRGNRPVINVSWDDVQSFIEWLNDKTGENYRLPTEAEWEYAARAGSTTAYSWGDNIGRNRANCSQDSDDGCGDSYANAAPVGSFRANAWGLHDMHGNVWEWVQDCWNESYAGVPSDGHAWTSGDCSQRVMRGGSWFDSALFLRSAYRSWNDRSNRNDFQGFRLAQDN